MWSQGFEKLFQKIEHEFTYYKLLSDTIVSTLKCKFYMRKSDAAQEMQIHGIQHFIPSHMYSELISRKQKIIK
jgi:spore maturation protein CgeB